MDATTHKRFGPIEHALALNGMLRDASEPLGEVPLVELQTKLANDDEFVLVMAMDRRRFSRAHIDGSVDFETFRAMAPGLSTDTEIIVYCTDPACAASILGTAMIVRLGFTNVRRYAGGLSVWAAAGLPLAKGVPQAT